MTRFNFVGDIVYMGPVTLNKDSLVNKAGLEVDIIPIMKSPCASPKPKRRKPSKRAKSEMGFHKDKYDNERGSLPDLHTKSKNITIKGSIMSTIMKMNPETFLSRSLEDSSDSILSENIMSRSLGSTDSLSKGILVNAVVNWLQRASPFGSTDNIMNQSWSTSLPDTNYSQQEEDDLELSALLSEGDQSQQSKSDNYIPPNIFISDDDDAIILLPAHAIYDKGNGKKEQQQQFRRDSTANNSGIGN